MKVSINWLKELIDLNIPLEELVKLLNLKTIGTKQVTDKFIELDMKGYNRADLLSLRGVAYEVSAITGSTIKFQEPDNKDYLWQTHNLPQNFIQVEAKDHCRVYCIVKLAGLKVEKSPPHVITKLQDSGMRAVNNITDVTNLVMLEYGQPLHAFDASCVADEKLIVRFAKENEKITTLDNKPRILTKSDLVIADPQKALGVAGVMGGKDSETSDATTTILLEAAIFDPTTLRKTATRLSLSSEASKRFYHGLTPHRLLQALDQAIRMYQDMGGKLVSICLAGDFKQIPLKVKLTETKTNSLIGITIPKADIIDYLTKLRFILKDLTGNSWEVEPPYFRLDINLEEDLIEEIARMYGYEKIPAIPLTGYPPEKVDQKLFEVISQIKSQLVTTLTEAQTYHFYSSKILEAFEINPETLVKIANPISAETQYLRPDIWPNLVEATVRNLKNYHNIALFEIGKVYHPVSNDRPEEEFRLSIALSNETNNPISELISVFNLLNDNLKFGVTMKAESGRANNFHPVRAVSLSQPGREVGIISEIHPKVLDQLGTDKRVAVLELSLTPFV